MTDTQLQTFYTDIRQRHFPTKNYDIQAGFYFTKTLRSTIRLDKKTLIICVAERFRLVPQEILALLGVILIAKLFHIKLPSEMNRAYREYVRQNILPELPTRSRRISDKYTAQGQVFNLDEIFTEMNRRYFSGQLARTIIGWSLQNSYARLGFYSQEKNLLVISRIFDSPQTPRQIVEYLMYHEMLHIALPTQPGKGSKRLIHSKEFRRLEKQFPNYEDIQFWLKHSRLLNRAKQRSRKSMTPLLRL